jgi:hypothetical protein
MKRMLTVVLYSCRKSGAQNAIDLANGSAALLPIISYGGFEL